MHDGTCLCTAHRMNHGIQTMYEFAEDAGTLHTHITTCSPMYGGQLIRMFGYLVRMCVCMCVCVFVS